jgi:ribosomal protein S18 acetylase RimI-like enzyme
MLAVNPVPLTASDIDMGAAVLFRAFAADPGVLFVLPDIAERERLAPSLARIMVRFVLRCGAPLVTSPPLRGLALWFPPDAEEPTSKMLIETGIAQVPDQIGPEPWQRLKRLIDHLDALHPQYAPEPHWYLSMLGVDPSWQRQGIGEALMRPIFEKADRDRLPCYLEAPTAENARYYERRGFRVVGETDISGTDIHVWFMRREPGA